MTSFELYLKRNAKKFDSYLATFFNDGKLTPETLATNMLGAVVKDPVQDTAVLGEYLETVLKKRRGFEGYYASLTDLI